MNVIRLLATVVLPLNGLCAIAQQAKQAEPNLGYVYPAGGQQGTTLEATIGGRYLNATGVYISGSGVTATILRQERQVTPAEQKELTETLNQIQEKLKQGRPVTAAERQQADAIIQKLNKFGRRLANPALGEFVTLQLTIDAKAPLGSRELRLRTPSGQTNPLKFEIGNLAEWTKVDWKNVPKSRDTQDPELDAKPPEQPVKLPLTVNGQIPPGGWDRYCFTAKKDDPVVIILRARELIPYIADASPGWFRATATLFNAQGKEIKPVDDFDVRIDPVQYYRIPAAGDYVLHVKDALYRGREDFIYRMSIGNLPFVAGAFPLGGKVGTRFDVALLGWNLRDQTFSLDLANKPAGIWPVLNGGLPNTISVLADTLPECLDQEPNNTAATAQRVKLPTIVNGRIEQPGDLDVYQFTGQAGDRIIAEVHARRLDSPLDSFLLVTDAAGNRLAYNDDHEDKGAGLNTHHADSYVAFTLPAKGDYFVQVGDIQQQGGPLYTYRLRLSAPRPDFQLRATPSALNVHGGASVPLTVHALRRDGFDGPISIRLQDAPRGFSLSNGEIPAQQDRATLTLNAATATTLEPFRLTIEGIATIANQEVVHPAIPADDVMQAFSYHQLVPAQDQWVTMYGRFRPGVSARVVSPLPAAMPLGGVAKVQVSVPAGPQANKVEYELIDPPAGITLQSATNVANGELAIAVDATKVQIGQSGTLIVQAFVFPPSAPGSDSAAGPPRRVPIGYLPAIPFRVVAPPK